MADMNITKRDLKRLKYKREIEKSETHNDWYVCTWTKVVEDENGRKFTIKIKEWDVGRLEEFGFPKYNVEAEFWRNDYKELFTVSYIGPEDATVEDIEKFFNEVWEKMSCQYDYED